MSVSVEIIVLDCLQGVNPWVSLALILLRLVLDNFYG